MIDLECNEERSGLSAFTLYRLPCGENRKGSNMDRATDLAYSYYTGELPMPRDFFETCARITVPIITTGLTRDKYGKEGPYLSRIKQLLLFSIVVAFGAVLINWLFMGNSSPLYQYFLRHGSAIQELWLALNFIPILLATLISHNHGGGETKSNKSKKSCHCVPPNSRF